MVIESGAEVPAYEEWMANRGLQVGARVAYSTGFGGVYEGLAMNDASRGALPLIVDAGLRVIPELYIGAYGQFASVLVAENSQSCPTGFDCSAQDWRLGLQVDYHFMPRTRLDPYIGLGGGYDILQASWRGSSRVQTAAGGITGSVATNSTNRGWEFAALTLGFDYRLKDFLGVGPFLTGTVGKYNVRSGDKAITFAGKQISDAPLPEVGHATHATFFAGVRGTFNPF